MTMYSTAKFIQFSYLVIICVIIIYMKKFLDSDWLRGVQFYFKLHCMQCKLIKQEQRLETSRKSNMASGISGVNFHLFSSISSFSAL